ncbi:MAG: hypothetical protein ACI9SJ_000579 [Flavobacteriaceae bacterium]|jgi:hypothetical protein
MEEQPKKYRWISWYTWILVINAVYIILFYLITKNYA